MALALIFFRHLASGAIEQPFLIHLSKGCYWRTRLKSRSMTPAMQAFSTCMMAMAQETKEAIA